MTEHHQRIVKVVVETEIYSKEENERGMRRETAASNDKTKGPMDVTGEEQEQWRDRRCHRQQ